MIRDGLLALIDLNNDSITLERVNQFMYNLASLGYPMEQVNTMLENIHTNFQKADVNGDGVLSR